LLEREWIRIAGHREVPGRPAVYVTTPQFLDHFNLKSLAELPLLSESPGELLEPSDPAPAPDRAAPIAREAAG
jgi:segregation and condensation protein B